MVQVSTYDTTGRPSRDVLSNEVCVHAPLIPSHPFALDTQAYLCRV